MATTKPKLPDVGTRVRLKWNGYPGVPLWLDGHFATILRTMRTRVVLHEVSGSAYDDDEYTVRSDQIQPVEGGRPTHPRLRKDREDQRA